MSPGATHSWLNVFESTGTASLTVRSNLKNYGFEIQYFLHWLAPYSETAGFVGYYRYEETPNPTLIFFADGKPRVQSTSEEYASSGMDLDEFLKDMALDEKEEDEESDHAS